MKDSEFIELLNLYLDHEITPADAARLEAEVLGNPARREIYRDYCRIQKGCKLLAQEFASETVAPLAEGKVVPFAPARAPVRRTGAYVGGLAAAAACVALIFVAGDRFGPSPAGVLQNAAAEHNTSAANQALAAAPARSTERTIGRTVTIPQTRETQPVLVTSLTLAGNSPTASSPLLAASEPNGAQFEWMRTMQLAPVQRVSIDEFRFDGRSPLRSDHRSYNASRLPPGPMEWNAIRYQK